ncbi:MAG: glycosyltransferase family 2 protein [Chloroflexota bacterium]|nr:glycosyltransferase family 2 protein [Chloroflexota bacterium]
MTEADFEAIEAHIESFKYQPLISILLPVNSDSEPWLQRGIRSILSQIYPDWELCIAVDASLKSPIQQKWVSQLNPDPRIKFIYCKANGEISTLLNAALAICSGKFVAMLDHDGIVREHALYMLANELNEHSEADIIYGDEDTIDEKGRRYNPYFKPDWNPDLFLSQNYLAHFTVYRASLVRQIGGFRKGYGGARDWDLAMRVSEKTAPAHIRHIPFVLYHHFRNESSMTLPSSQNKDAQYNLLISHFERIGQEIEISYEDNTFLKIRYPLPEPKPLVSVIIPTRNHLKLLIDCLDSLLKKTHYSNYEVLIVNNQSDDLDTIAYFEALQGNDKVFVLEYDHPFNYSAINNFAVQHAGGDVLVFMNNDIEVISPYWLDEMVSHAIRPDIGAVGALLYYDDNTIQHAGVILGAGGVAGHAYLNWHRKDFLQKTGVFVVRNYSAVTGACMAVEKRKFEDVGRFNEKQLPIIFNDVDFCLRLLENDYRNLLTPYAELYHHESASRGHDSTTKQRNKHKQEQRYMLKKWGTMLKNDPAYNPNLALSRNAFSLAFPPRVRSPWKD